MDRACRRGNMRRWSTVRSTGACSAPPPT